MAEPTPKVTAWISASGRELKLAIVTGLAGIYLAIWPQLGVGSANGSAPDATTAEPVANTSLAPSSPRLSGAEVTWIDQLPASERPALVVPAGWVLADRSAPPTAARVTTRTRPAPIRVAATRAHRIRTRSS